MQWGKSTGTKKQGYPQDVHHPLTAQQVPRSLPFSEDGEKGVLSSLLISPREVADVCVLHLRCEAFYVPAHQIIYSLVLEFHDKSKPIDFIPLKQALTDRNQIQEIGGPEYLSDLWNFVPTPANAGFYIEIVREKYVLRRLISACTKLTTQCYEQEGKIAQLLDEAEKEIFAITGEHVKTEIVPTKALVMEAIEQIEKLYENRGSVTGLSTGFIELENTPVPESCTLATRRAGQKRPVSPKSSPFRSTLEITRSSENKRPGPAELPRMQENGNPLA